MLRAEVPKSFLVGRQLLSLPTLFFLFFFFNFFNNFYFYFLFFLKNVSCEYDRVNG